MRKETEAVRRPIKRHVALLAVLVIGAAAIGFVCWYAYRVNGHFGFPLDDPWIHLQFARNLHDFGVFSYYKDAAPTFGATGPLYMALLALGFVFTSNEFLLSYGLGVVFFLLSAVLFFRVAERILTDSQLAAAAAFLFLLEPRLQWAALSGMETTFFIFLLLLTTDQYQLGRGWRAGVSACLLLWVRPEAVLFVAVLVLDALYHHVAVARVLTWQKFKQTASSPAAMCLYQIVALFALTTIGYGLFNWRLSGSLLPNTYGAKIAAYSFFGGEDFPVQVLRYLSGGHLHLVAVFAAVALIPLLVNVCRRKSEPRLILLLWCLALFFAYRIKIPYLYQEGRYLMPLIPFFLLLGVSGALDFLRMTRSHLKIQNIDRISTATVVLLFAVVGCSTAVAAWSRKEVYSGNCKSIHDRQVSSALWIRDNLPPDAIVATHDIGAIGYYSNRRVVDMVGLVSPEAIPFIGHNDKLVGFLERKGVSHLAVLDSWFVVANQRPLFQTGIGSGEVMQVFPFIGERTHFTLDEVSFLVRAAQAFVAERSLDSAKQALEQAITLDPLSAHPRLMLASIYAAQGDSARAQIQTVEAQKLIDRAHP